jgi:hypothetical protein
MATRRTVKSESGATMSQYDQEVEKRLQALEATAHEKCEGGGGDSERVAALEAKVDDLIEKLKSLKTLRAVL